MALNFRIWDKYTKPAIIIIIIASILRISLALLYQPSGDACWHFSVSRFIALNGKLPLFEGLGRDEPFWAPPLFHFLASFVYKFFLIFGKEISEFFIKLISPVFGILTIIVSYMIFLKLFNKKVSFFCLLFICFIPISIDYHVYGYVESVLAFFVVLSVFFALNNMLFFSSLSAGLSVLTKYNGIFILPLVAYLFFIKNKHDKKLAAKKILFILLIPILISSPWLIRNYILLGNPVWPFLNFVFHGINDASYSGFDVSRLISPDFAVSLFFGFFGIPDGNPATLTMFDNGIFAILFKAWILLSFLFILPIFFSRGIKKELLKILFIWTGAFFVLLALYVANVGFYVSRMFLPAIPSLAVFWGFGYLKILNSLKRYENILNFSLFLITIAFITGILIKIIFAANLWNFYSKDFDFVDKFTKKSDIILAGGQCANYYIGRETLPPKLENVFKAHYAIINQHFNLDKRLIVSNEILSTIRQEGMLIYKNDLTKTEIYKMK